MTAPLHTVVETNSYLRDAKTAGVSAAEREAIVTAVSTLPDAGEEVVGSGGVRKMRVAGRGKGKRGGYRVMVAYVGTEFPAYILAILSKGDRENFTEKEVKAMRDMMAQIKSARGQK